MLRLEARPKNLEGEGEIPIRELVRNSLRMRPDRIIVGEVRGAEALDMLQAMNTGHDGSLSTVHSNSPRDALSRIETMVLMAGYDLPVRAIREQVASALDADRPPRAARGRLAPGHLGHRGAGHGVGRDHDAGAVQVPDRRGRRGTARSSAACRPTGLRPTFLQKFEKRGISLPLGLFQAPEAAFGAAAAGGVGR